MVIVGGDCGLWCMVMVIVGGDVRGEYGWWCMVVVIVGGDVVNVVGGVQWR